MKFQNKSKTVDVDKEFSSLQSAMLSVREKEKTEDKEVKHVVRHTK